MSVTALELPIPAQYLRTGDHAFIMAWATLDDPERAGHQVIAAVLCLEDGSVEIANTDEFKFDFRWSEKRQRFVDVSGVPVADPEGDEDADSDQEPAGDGSEGVPGRIPETD